jgi:hypothetical protein
MKSTAEMHEERIRERAYHIWEANGRPLGRDTEFWRQACDMVAVDDARSAPRLQRPESGQAEPPRPPRKRSRRAPRMGSPEISPPAG